MSGNDRVHRYLDGELPESALTAEERAERHRFERVIADVVETRPPGSGVDVTDAVLARIASLEGSSAGPVSRWRTAAGSWLWTPRSITIRFRPALAAAALLALLAWPLALRVASDDDRVPPVEAARVFVQFRLDAPSASSVMLAGDFTGWAPAHALHETEPGVWSVVVALEPGVHDYAFVVDGDRWVSDPLAGRVDDGFGGVNSRIAVLLPEARRSS